MLRSFGYRRWLLAAVGLGLLAAGAGGYAYASGLTANQQFTGCLLSGSISSVTISPSPPKACQKPAVQISWNQTGPPGQAGTNGTNGTSVTSTALQAGDDANCPNGGSKFTAAGNNVTYACNGQNGTSLSSIDDLAGLGCSPTAATKGTISVSYSNSDDVTLHCTINEVDTQLAAASNAGDTNVKVDTVSGIQAGGVLTIDPGTASEESQTVTAVGTAAHATTLAAASVPGDTNIKVASVTGMTVGHEIEVDSGANEEVFTIVVVGTAGATGTGITLSNAVSIAHAAGAPVRDVGTGVTLAAPLTNAHAEGAVVKFHN